MHVTWLGTGQFRWPLVLIPTENDLIPKILILVNKGRSKYKHVMKNSSFQKPSMRPC